MPFDFKKEYKEYYLPPAKPVIVTVPKANYIGLYYTAFCDFLFLLTRCLFVTESRFS